MKFSIAFFAIIPVIASAGILEAVDSMPDAHRYGICPELRGSRYYAEKVKTFCVGCESSPYATEEWIEQERKDAAAKIEKAEERCLINEKIAKEQEIARRQEMRAKEQYKKEQERRKNLPGVTLGMTRSQVINETVWGKPQSINTTITPGRTHEQWVYGRNYLYFDNGILTAIQTGQ